MDEQWFRNKMSNLQIKDSLNDLAEIREKLQSLNSDQIAEASDHLQLSKVFACIDSTNKNEQNTVACDILSLCLSNLDLNKTENNLLLLEDMIKHPTESVQVIGLEELLRVVKKKPGVIQSPLLVVDLVKCLASDSTTVGTLAMKILELSVLEKFIDNSDIKSALDEICGQRAVVKCRLYELVVNVTKNSPECLSKFDFILEKIVSELLDNGDVLLQLNVMEILSEMAQTETGLSYLDEKGVFNKMISSLEFIDSMSILLPGFIKFLGCVASSHPEKIFQKYSQSCKLLFETVSMNYPETLGPALDTLGILGVSKEGKIGLDEVNSNSGNDIMAQMKSILQSSTNDKIRVLNCLEMLFRSEEEPNNRLETITENWYKSLDNGTGLTTILELSRNPFPDIKLAALGFLKSVISYNWGRDRLTKTAGFIEYLLDRNIEFKTEAIQAKFEIISFLNSTNVAVNEEIRKEMKDYVEKGAFYKKGITEVAMDPQ